MKIEQKFYSSEQATFYKNENAKRVDLVFRFAEEEGLKHSQVEEVMDISRLLFVVLDKEITTHQRKILKAELRKRITILR